MKSLILLLFLTSCNDILPISDFKVQEIYRVSKFSEIGLFQIEFSNNGFKTFDTLKNICYIDDNPEVTVLLFKTEKQADNYAKRFDNYNDFVRYNSKIERRFEKLKNIKHGIYNKSN